MAWAPGNYKGRAEIAPPAHGTASRYRRGCRCDGCRRAYATHQRDQRARRKHSDMDYTVSAELAREHLLELRKAHVGKRAVCAVTGISDLRLMAIANGTQRRIRQSTEEKIMAVTTEARSDGSLISGKETTRRIDHMIAALGISKSDIAEHLGYKRNDGIQFYGRPRVTAANALRVERLYHRLMGANTKPADHDSRVERMLALQESIALKTKWIERAA